MSPEDKKQQEIDDLRRKLALSEFATELRILLSLELDIKSCLCTYLEVMMQYVGPFNAVVFLPAGEDEYRLGAYCNYDLSRNEVDAFFDEIQADINFFITEEPDDEEIRDKSPWYSGFTFLYGEAAGTGILEDEQLAFVFLAADENDPFLEWDREMFVESLNILGAQLAKIAKVEHRLSPDFWDEPDSNEQDGDRAHPSP